MQSSSKTTIARRFRLHALLLLFCSGLPAAEAGAATPTTIQDSLVLFRYAQGQGGSSRLCYFRPDGTFADITASGGHITTGWSPHALRRGTYELVDFPDDETRIDLIRRYDDNETTDIYRMDFRDEYSGGHAGGIGTLSFTVFPRLSNEDLRNVSNRTWIGPGKTATTGFIINETSAARWVLIRGVGKTLRQFGVNTTAETFQLTLHTPQSNSLQIDAWDEGFNDPIGIAEAFRLVGAFPLEENSGDRTLLTLLEPSAYTVQADSEEEGEILTEIYQLPFGRP